MGKARTMGAQLSVAHDSCLTAVVGPQYQFQWDQIPLAKPNKPKWRPFKPHDNHCLVEAYEDHIDENDHYDLSGKFFVDVPLESMYDEEPQLYSRTPKEQFGLCTHQKKGWQRRVRAWKTKKGTEFQWDEHVIEQPGRPYEWSNFGARQNALLNSAFAGEPGSMVTLESAEGSTYGVTVPFEICPDGTIPKRANSKAQPFFGLQVSAGVAGTKRLVRAVPVKSFFRS